MSAHSLPLACPKSTVLPDAQQVTVLQVTWCCAGHRVVSVKDSALPLPSDTVQSSMLLAGAAGSALRSCLYILHCRWSPWNTAAFLALPASFIKGLDSLALHVLVATAGDCLVKLCVSMRTLC